jgi:hypothetical protein
MERKGWSRAVARWTDRVEQLPEFNLSLLLGREYRLPWPPHATIHLVSSQGHFFSLSLAEEV